MNAAAAEARDVPFLDLSDPAFSVRSAAVREAREKSWYAKTPYGLAVLRHAEMGRFLNHPSLRQGSHNWPALNGVTSGMFSEWWMTTILVTEGADHRRLRKAATPAFSGRTIQRLEPDFIKLAEQDDRHLRRCRPLRVHACLRQPVRRRRADAAARAARQRRPAHLQARLGDGLGARRHLQAGDRPHRARRRRSSTPIATR